MKRTCMILLSMCVWVGSRASATYEAPLAVSLSMQNMAWNPADYLVVASAYATAVINPKHEKTAE